MSQADKDPKKKHRHDVGAVDHGPIESETTTRNIQILLGLWVLASVALTVYALAEAAFQISAS